MGNRTLWQLTASSVADANAGEKTNLVNEDARVITYGGSARVIINISEMVSASERVIQKQNFELNDYENNSRNERVLMLG